MSLFPLPQKYYRLSGTAGYVAGKYVPGSWVEFDFKGSIQPMKSYQIKNLEVGEIILGAVKIYTVTKFNISKQGEAPSDLVLFDEDYYKIVTKSPYKSGLIEHYKYEAILYTPGIS